ncbi:C40 family peptidase [Catenulispora sp. NF23]|uniref:C40 family peptidase n=1 Tax=Catenulispora pinistramenti TaxID=2705254 RepID=A0ABS5KMV0_9ACTN|nr:NlpC/P60 family protein [Catenulispora pinistramenti]MBS2531414.1 C40 family peptidase [Catenulispora pinistramenti]MBS2547346.1 C40 family peptidase [Catenulispora pinistramenti]
MKLRSRIARLEIVAATAVALTGVGLAAGTANAASAPAPIKLTSAQCPADISSGQHSGCVTELQELLNKNGAHIAVDGDFGPATLAAVKSYQSGHGLSVDGIVGPDTKAALDGTSTPPPPTGGGQSKVVDFARAIESGKAERGWGGGRVPYGWDGGHTASPGPSPADCAADGGDQACYNATAHHTLGHNGQISVDCSGFVRWVYSLAYGRDVFGPDGTSGQIAKTHRVSSPAAGDLVFFGSNAGSPEHVGIYIGGGKMIDALDTGTYVETDSVSTGGRLIGYYRF